MTWEIPLAGAAAVVLLVLLLSWRGRRQVVRRVGTVVNRLEDRPTEVEGRGGNLESALARLERTAERANERRADVELALDRVRAVLRSLDDGVVVVSETGRVVYRNDAAERFFEARHGDAIVEDAIGEMLAGALRGSVVERDLQLYGPPQRSLALRAVPLSEAGGPGGALALIRDVSTAKRVDSVRRDFVANVSHELRTPIGAVIALAETVEADDDPVVMRRLATRVREEVERLGRIVDDLLDLSMLEAQEPRDRERVTAASLIRDAVDRVASAAEQSGVRVEIGPVASGLAVECDRRHVVSALYNLLENAVKYSKVEGGEPEPLVDVGVTPEGGSAVFWIRDRGIGIPERDRGRIFERFYRVDRARSRASGGTGLGLAIVRHVAQAHGGTVSVESEEGVGSTFSLVLPAVPGSRRRGPARGDRDRSGERAGDDAGEDAGETAGEVPVR